MPILIQNVGVRLKKNNVCVIFKTFFQQWLPQISKKLLRMYILYIILWCVCDTYSAGAAQMLLRLMRKHFLFMYNIYIIGLSWQLTWRGTLKSDSGLFLCVTDWVWCEDLSLPGRPRSTTASFKRKRHSGG